MVESDLKAVLRFIQGGGKNGRTRRDIVRRFQRMGKRGLEEVIVLAETGCSIVSRQSVSEGTYKPTTTYYLPEFAPEPEPADA